MYCRNGVEQEMSIQGLVPTWLLCMTIYRKYLPLIKQRNCLCAASCIKASLSASFADWGNPPAGWMPPWQRLLFWHISPHTPNATSFGKIISCHTCGWIICVHKAQTGGKSKRLCKGGMARNGRFLTWTPVNEKKWKAFHQKKKKRKETCGQVRAIIIDKPGGTGSSWGMGSYKMVPWQREGLCCGAEWCQIS